MLLRRRGKQHLQRPKRKKQQSAKVARIRMQKRLKSHSLHPWTKEKLIF